MEIVEPIRAKQDIEKMKRALRAKSERDYVMFMVGINAGLRVSDILQLRVRDVRGTHIRIREQKTQKYKSIVINSVLRKAIDPYIKYRRNDEYLIKSRQGDNKHISRQQAYYILRDAAKSCGIESVGTHTMRKTFGYHMYQRTKDIVAIQKIFNHDHPSTTMAYLGIDREYTDKLVSDNVL